MKTLELTDKELEMLSSVWDFHENEGFPKLYYKNRTEFWSLDEKICKLLGRP